MSRREYERRPGSPSPGEKVANALETLEHGIDSILSSEGFAAYLKTMARFHSYSFGNVLLIQMQRPDATWVAGYRRWMELGRQVKKGEKGISILVPHKRKIQPENEDDEERFLVRSFGVGTVFDVSQTDGEPLPEPPQVELINGASDVGMRLYVDLVDYLDTRSVPVSREGTGPANGSYNPHSRRIAVGLHIDGDQATKTLTHEAAHAIAGHTLDMNSRDVETVAESAAFVVLNHYEIDSSGYSFAYVSRWAGDRAVFKENLAAIQSTANEIISGLEGEDRKSGRFSPTSSVAETVIFTA